MAITIVLELKDGKEIKLSVEEAKEIMGELKQLLGEENIGNARPPIWVDPPYPPVYQPPYQPPVVYREVTTTSDGLYESIPHIYGVQQ